MVGQKFGIEGAKMLGASFISDELRKKYCDRRAEDVEEISSALERKRFDLLSKVGHQLRGSASTYGYEPLSSIGQKMEFAAQHRCIQEGQECLFALKAWLQEQNENSGESG